MAEILLDVGGLIVSLIPEAGGKILDLVESETGFNLLWQNPRVPLSRPSPGAHFDDVWCGGWDDMFPTDAACDFDGTTYNDHGDLWIGPWEWEVATSETGRPAVHLWRYSPSLPCRIDKWLAAGARFREIEVRLVLTNLGLHPVRFVWNQHIAHAIGPGSRVHLPTSRLSVEDSRRSRAGDARDVTWPLHDQVDLSRLPGPETGYVDFLCARDLEDGWCVVTHPLHGVAIKLGFDREVFTRPWLWGVYGGWRGHHLLLTELCTSYPGNLATAVRDGSAAVLAAGASIDTTMSVTVTREFDAEAPGDTDPTICASAVASCAPD